MVTFNHYIAKKSPKKSINNKSGIKPNFEVFPDL